MSERIAVTGGTGFIGRHFLNAAQEEGWRISALTRREPPTPEHSAPEPTAPEPAAPSPIEWIPGSLEDPEALTRLVGGTDVVVHAAGAIKARHRRDFRRVNVAALERLVVQLRRTAPAARLIFLSSLAAREPAISAYAESKALAEEFLQRDARDIAWTVVRPPLVYGPGDRETLKMFKAVQRGVVPVPRSHQGRLSVIHVQDLVRAMLALAGDENAPQRILEVDDQHPNGYDLHGLFEAAARHAGRGSPLRALPRPVLLAAGYINLWAGMLSGIAPMITPGKIREALHPDWTAAQEGYWRGIGWEAQFDLETGLAETVEWYRGNGALR